MKRFFKEHTYDFSNYRLSVSQPGVRVFIVIAGVFNLLLLIPDIINLQGAAQTAVWVLRLSYFAVCAAFFFSIGKFRTFKALSLAVSATELLAAVVFLVVFSLYSTPNFMIQLLDIMLIILGGQHYFIRARFSCHLYPVYMFSGCIKCLYGHPKIKAIPYAVFYRTGLVIP